MVIAIIITVLVLAAILGFLAKRGTVQSDLASWSVGGRSYGAVLFWLLAAGEIYSTATFLGGSGGVYSVGSIALWVLGYGTVAFSLGYLYLPQLWEYASKHNLVTQADFFAHRYNSRGLGAIFGLAGVAFMIPYIEVQLLGFGQILEVTSGGLLPRDICMLVSFAVVSVFVFTSGMNATAWVSVLKDILMIGAMIVVGLWLPLHYFGSFGEIVDKVNTQMPGHLLLNASTPQDTALWMITTLIVSGLAFFMFPHSTAAIFSAKSAKTIRRNMMYLPLYNILLIFPIMVGVTALLVVPGIEGPATNAVLLDLSLKVLPDWVVGLIGAAGALSAIVPVSLLVLQSATQLSKNVFQDVVSPEADERTVLKVSRYMVFFVMAISVGLSIAAPDLLVSLLQVGQIGVSQFIPAVILGLFWSRINRSAMITGTTAGFGIVIVCVATGTNTLLGANVGFVALACNTILCVGGSMVFGTKNVPNVQPDA